MKKIKVNNMSKNYIISCLFVDLIDLVKKKDPRLTRKNKERECKGENEEKRRGNWILIKGDDAKTK